MNKLAVCSVVNKEYLKYLSVFAFSLIKHNPSFSRDYVVFYKKGDLEEEDFSKLRKIYKGFVFKEIDTEKYQNINWSGKDRKSYDQERNLDTGDSYRVTDHQHFIGQWVYYRLELFKLKEYDQVIWLDIDMLVLKNLKPLFEMREDDKILACEDILCKSLKPKYIYDRDHKVQGGLVVVGKNLLSEKVYGDLIGLLDHAYKYPMNDQTMFTEYFGKSGKLKNISPVFNTGRKLVAKGNYRVEEVFIIHYPGSKKPHDLKTDRRRNDCRTFSLWHRVEEEMKEACK